MRRIPSAPRQWQIFPGNRLNRELELAGFAVEEYASVEQARSHIVAGMPAVLLCDVRLPGMSGTNWLREVRVVDPDIPVILVTGHGDIAMAVRAMREGAYDFIEKPFSSEHLLAARRYRRPIPELTRGRQAELMRHSWPGNVRELRNVADRFVLGLLDELRRLRLTTEEFRGDACSS